MSIFDSEEYEASQAEKRLAPLFARMPEDYPPGMISIGSGWVDLVVALDQRLAEIDPDYTVLQVKEKFGLLRYYVQTSEDYVCTGDFMTDPFWALVREAEDASGRICEDCGTEGRQRKGGWIITLCDACETARGGKRRIK
jgi:hypothetical protein